MQLENEMSRAVSAQTLGEPILSGTTALVTVSPPVYCKLVHNLIYDQNLSLNDILSNFVDI